MAQHTDDGRVKAVDKRTGKIIREHPHIIKKSPWLDYPPSAKKTEETPDDKPEIKQISEPAKKTGGK